MNFLMFLSGDSIRLTISLVLAASVDVWAMTWRDEYGAKLLKSKAMIMIPTVNRGVFDKKDRSAFSRLIR